MRRAVAWEVNAPEPGAMLLLGRDPGAEEMRQGRPFVGQAGAQLDDLLATAGIDRRRVNVGNVVNVQPPGNAFAAHNAADVTAGLAHLSERIAALQPNVIVAMGNEAAWAAVHSWPGARDGSRGAIGGARDISRRRGFLWGPQEHTLHGRKVLTTLHPSAVMRDVSGISAMLVAADLERAWQHRLTPVLQRPKLHVNVVRTAAQASAAAAAIAAAGVAACDIEITHAWPHACLCVGFAVDAATAYVYPQAWLRYAYDLLRLPTLRTIWQNGQFDLHFLLSRHGVRVAGAIDDTIVQWHTRWPEIAGAKVDVDGGRRGTKATRKSLAFFASLGYGGAWAWWKDYDTDVDGMLQLCGQDCAVTFATHAALAAELQAQGLQECYALTMRRVWPVVEMQHRGLLVSEAARSVALQQLEARKAAAVAELQALAQPLLECHRDRVPKPRLIWKRARCKCCSNGAKKRQACMRCAGLPAKPTKADYVASASALVRLSSTTPTQKAAALRELPRMKLAELKALVLKPCRQCAGAGAWDEYAFNPGSNEQMAMLLYDVLRIPRRSGVDEATLKSVLGQVRAVRQGIQAGGDRQEVAAAG